MRLRPPTFTLSLVLLTSIKVSAQSGAWLDSQPRPWNRPRRSLPKAPIDIDRDEISSICKPPAQVSPFPCSCPERPNGRDRPENVKCNVQVGECSEHVIERTSSSSQSKAAPAGRAWSGWQHRAVHYKYSIRVK